MVEEPFNGVALHKQGRQFAMSAPRGIRYPPPRAAYYLWREKKYPKLFYYRRVRLPDLGL